MASRFVRVEKHGAACELQPLAVTRPDPWNPGLLYEWAARIEISPTEMMKLGGDAVRENMIEMFTKAIDAYIERNKASISERRNGGEG